MEFNGLLALAALWFFLNLITKLGRKGQAPPRPQQPRPPPMRQMPIPSAPDATQKEGRRLELVLREFQRALEDAASGPGDIPLPRPEEEEEGRSLEVEPEVRSLEEEDVGREARRRFAQDDDAERLVARRIAAAVARDAATTKVHHAELEEIHRQPADHTATRGYTAQQLRRAVVWREILGPPVSMRDERSER